MDLIRQQLERIQQQLAGLSITQKMLSGTLVVIVAMTMLYWSRLAGTSEMQPLFDRALSPDELSRVTGVLSGRNIAYESQGDRIMVPSNRAVEAWSLITYEQALPGNTQSAFDSMLDRLNTFDSNFVAQGKMNRAREVTIAQMIARWPEVAQADVVVDPTTRVGVQRRQDPSATVNIITRNKAGGGKKLAETAADAVVGALAGLKRSRVSVVIDGMAYQLKERDASGAPGGSEILDMVRAHESYMVEKLREHFSYIQGVQISVTAELNTKRSTETRKSVDPTQKVQIAKRETTDTEETNSGSSAQEPGAVANIALNGQPAVSQDRGSTSERSETENVVDYGVTQTTTDTPAGDAKTIGASAGVPRSYFVSVWKGMNPSLTTEPTDAELQPMISAQLESIRGDIRTITQIKDESMVRVEQYFDVNRILSSESIVKAGAGEGVTMIATGYAKEAVLGLLAVVSLFMVNRMVKKSIPPAPQPVTIGGITVGGNKTSRLEAGDDIAGEVVEQGTVMMGQELDLASLETQQMVEQVSTLVKERPDAAAQLIKRWLART